MSLNKTKKSIKSRGMRSHGYGSHKKHRGSGHQGGHGMAGTGKKADSKKTKIWKDPLYFGRHFFVSKNAVEIKYLNIFYIENHLEVLVEKNLVKKQGDTYVVDLKDFGCNKLLGSGAVKHKYSITTEYASKAAVEKVEAAKGTVTLTAKVEDSKSE